METIILEDTITILIKFILAIVLAGFFHEGGHWLAAKHCNQDIHFFFEWKFLFDKIPIPTFTWYMPNDLNKSQKKLIAMAGFGTELFMIIVLILIFGIHFWEYVVTVLTHMILYRFYVKESSDFKWF
jgi:hypothetical protein